ncbi:hypothetical protein FHS31_001514 [Sphingomonas vulcanisoli]|uniref:DUF6894 domain-containing protein n=1 Tax=Sphingomonas vulcanisoli TaxID=1658060 RepID=A0ABX0TT31_9SPHN|nr:hypothetical protein [Sphingomonas vulcanisoli]NIJ07904.1 hypothetical protein [Sphingomonas vulcanisoli]
MKHYHLNLYNDVVVADEEGIELPDLPAAKACAIEAVRALIADSVVEGRLIKLDHRVEVTDDRGKVLAVIPFGEVIEIEGMRLAH